jgi:1-aminocyclopropane-1-carboxylate deaminase/D-cysteine desulfhydrase-like pyridoxal-dependent ACC family enzyme
MLVRDATALTPLQQVGDFFVKRDDLFEFAGVRGGKARTCWTIAQGAHGLVTAGNRSSPAGNIVAHVARALGVPCRVHVPAGAPGPQLVKAKAAGAVIIPHSPGYPSVINRRALDDAKERGWQVIPFGMECVEAVRQTAAQACATVVQMHSLTDKPRRVVVPVGSGMSLAGILHGFAQAEITTPVVGVVVGACPVKRLNKWAPPNWRDLCELVRCDIDFNRPVADARLGDVELDPIFEAKCLAFLRSGDLLWIVGIGQSG